MVMNSLRKTRKLVIAEEVCEAGCIGSVLASCAAEQGIAAKVCLLNLGCGIVPHGSRDQLMRDYGIDAASIAEHAAEICSDQL